jgi:hypothetical protein
MYQLSGTVNIYQRNRRKSGDGRQKFKTYPVILTASVFGLQSSVFEHFKSVIKKL